MYKVKPSIDVKGKGKVTPETDIKGHTDEVLCLAISGDEKVLASSGRDRRICVWDVETCEWKKTFSGYLGHKDAITV
jgi:ribosomal RNA-processing protein 9